MNPTRIEQVLAAHRTPLLALPGVVGVAQGICAGEPCIRVFVADTTDAQHAHIPRQIEGFPVQIDVTTPFRAREDAP